MLFPRCTLAVVAVVVLGVARVGAQEANAWQKAAKAEIVGRRWDVPVGYAPELQQFVVLGGRGGIL